MPDTAEPPAPDAAGRPPVSFFIAAYNQERFVRAAIEGAFAQTYRPLEILLSDDCSGDGTFEVMREMAAAYDGPHTVRLNRNPENLGIPGHVDRIMQLTRGAFVVQNAGDDVSVPERTERLVAAWLASGRRARAIHSAKHRIDQDGNPLPAVPEPDPVHRHAPLALLRRPPAVAGASMGWAREVFDRFGPLGPTPVFEDYPICLRAATLGEVLYLETPLLHYRVGGLSWRAEETIGHYVLYGHRQKFLRWHLSFSRLYLEDLDRVAPPDADACRAQCLKNIRDFSCEIALAEMPPAARLGAVPRAAWSSLRLRDGAPLRKTLKYAFDGPYMSWLDWRSRAGRRLTR